MTKSAQLSYFNNLQYKLIGHRNGGGTFADSARAQPQRQVPGRAPGEVHLADRHREWWSTSRTAASAPTTSSASEPEVQDGDISRFDAVTNTYTVALPTYRDNAMFRDQVLGSVSFFTGRHDIRFGYQFIDGGEKSSTWSTSGMRAVYRNGVPIR